MGMREVVGIDNPQAFIWLSNDEGELIVTVLDIIICWWRKN